MDRITEIALRTRPKEAKLAAEILEKAAEREFTLAELEEAVRLAMGLVKTENQRRKIWEMKIDLEGIKKMTSGEGGMNMRKGCPIGPPGPQGQVTPPPGYEGRKPVGPGKMCLAKIDISAGERRVILYFLVEDSAEAFFTMQEGIIKTLEDLTPEDA